MSDTQIAEEIDAQNPMVRRMAIAFGVVTAILVAVYFVATRLNYEVLYSDLDISDASMIAAELERQELNYRVADQGETILVNKRHADDIRLSLYAADGSAQGISGFELFNESEMGLTDFAQRIKFQRAIQGELGRTIMMMDGVKKARVHVAIPERSVFRSQNTSPKAAISILFKEGVEWKDENILGIQRLVASSIPGLALHHVTVIDGNGQIISRTSEILDYDAMFDERDYDHVVNSSNLQADGRGVFKVASLSISDERVVPADASAGSKASVIEAELKADATLQETASATIGDGNENALGSDAAAPLPASSTGNASAPRDVQAHAIVSREDSNVLGSDHMVLKSSTLTNKFVLWSLAAGLFVLLGLGIFWIIHQKNRRMSVGDYDAFSLELSRALQSKPVEAGYA